MRRPAGIHGFTLAEILIALGLFAVATAGMIALFPRTLRIAREGEEEARAARIASNLLEVLDGAPRPGTFRLAGGISAEGLRMESIDPDDPHPHPVAYGMDCLPVRLLSEEEAGRPVDDGSVSDVATLRLSRSTAHPGMILAEVDVAGPASAPSAGRSSHRFLRLLPDPGHGS
jgi:prepilin-type N-terminal cleavage/methylation domain-containing protein